jgi:hypothetical protein
VGASAGKSGDIGVRRLGAGAGAPAGESGGAPAHRLRALPRADRAGPAPWPERHGDLAGPRRRPPPATPASGASSPSNAAPSFPDAHPVIVTGPGEEGQVDYGTGPMVRDPATGKYRRTRLFVLTLGRVQPQSRPPARVPLQRAHLTDRLLDPGQRSTACEPRLQMRRRPRFG